jgi:hypothetical protein
LLDLGEWQRFVDTTDALFEVAYVTLDLGTCSPLAAVFNLMLKFGRIAA